jgi:hypothetical protein
MMIRENGMEAVIAYEIRGAAVAFGKTGRPSPNCAYVPLLSIAVILCLQFSRIASTRML